MPRRRDPEWHAAVVAFLGEKRRAGCSQATLDVYSHVLDGRRMRLWRDGRGVTHLSGMDADAVRDLERTLAEPSVDGRVLKPSSVSVHHRTLHTFLRWCRDEGWAVGEAALRVPAPRLGQHEPATLSVADEKRVLAACSNDRDRYLIELLVRSGLRLSEVCALTLDDIVTGADGTLIRVRAGKGNKDRVIPLDTSTYRGTRRLHQYIDRVRPDTHRRELFLAQRRVGGDYPPMSAHSVKVLMLRLSAATGVHVHAHQLRHTFASRAIAAGVDPLTLARILGHTSLQLTSRYVHFDGASLARAWQKRTD